MNDTYSARLYAAQQQTLVNAYEQSLIWADEAECCEDREEEAQDDDEDAWL